MYQKPFGSIFAADITPTPELPPTEIEVKKIEQEIATPPPLKPLFDHTAPQFKAAVTVTTADPEIKLAQASLLSNKAKLQLEAFQRILRKTKSRIKNAQIYKATLSELAQLPPNKQNELETFFSGYAEKIKQLAKALELNDISQEFAEAAKALDLEIQQWDEIKQTKGKRQLRIFRPTEVIVKDTPPNESSLPIFKGKPFPMDKIARLNKQGVAIAKGYDGLGESYYQKFAKQQPSTASLKERRIKGFERGDFRRGIEKNVLSAKEYQWQIAETQRDINSELLEYNKIQAEADALSKKILEINPDLTKTIAGLGVLSLYSPKNMMIRPLLDAVTSAVTTPSQLGETPEAVLNTTVATTQAALKELQTREKVLDTLVDKVLEPKKSTIPSFSKNWLLLGALVLFFIWLRRGE